MLIEKIGKSAMLEQTAEECVELAHACLKLARYYRNENKVYGKSEEEILDNLAEEMADVELCAMELKKGLELYDEFLAQKDKKRARLRKRLEEQEGQNEETDD